MKRTFSRTSCQAERRSLIRNVIRPSAFLSGICKITWRRNLHGFHDLCGEGGGAAARDLGQGEGQGEGKGGRGGKKEFWKVEQVVEGR